MRYYLLLLFIGFGLCFTSCREDFEFERSSNASLEFSRDTVYLDTVFTNIGSSTYTLKVYNRSDKDIKIPSIHLGQNNDSDYRLMVDGVPGKIFNDVELLAKDSMFIFIETTIDYSEYANSETTFLYTDNIQFEHTNGTQQVELVTLVQDAVFIKPNRPLPDDIKETVIFNTNQIAEGHELTTPEELHWTNEKPYVVYGYAYVPDGSTLTVDPGTRVHFHAESGLIVDSNATLNINGSLSSTEELENEVIFEGDRLEPEFADTAGQWSGIYLVSGNDNRIEHLTLKNSVVGIFMYNYNTNIQPRLTINNSQIYNSLNVGVYGRHAIINADNLVANNSGQASIALLQGGTANFRQCTFANYFSSFNQVPVAIKDYDDVPVPDPATNKWVIQRRVSNVVANFDNCILYGSSNLGISHEHLYPDDVTYATKFNHCLIKIIDTSNQLKNNPLYPSDGNDPEQALYTECVIAKSSINDKPDFLDPQNNMLNIGEDSAANGTADAAVATAVGADILGIGRQSPYDMGAYESVVFTED